MARTMRCSSEAGFTNSSTTCRPGASRASWSLHSRKWRRKHEDRPRMNIPAKPKIVLLGMMTKMPVAGVVWQTLHYLIGFRRLGFDVYYVEEHARTPSMFMETEQSDGSAKAAAFLSDMLTRF